ncbi:hypothetical protein SDC9_86262 [bioreactor metagenome]|uniref:Uncharacterized protein n=1 Tax=bioreactor metagenome TaxID=1076179 RepID=A0A644ZH41_9ZZZZ
MKLSDKIYSITIDKVDYPLRSQESYTYNYVYNPRNYKKDNFHSAFLISIETANNKSCIELIGSFYSNPDRCAILEDSKLIVLMDDVLVEFDLETLLALKYKTIGDETYFSLYPITDGYLIHGELSILRLDRNFEQTWSFYGSDIWVVQDGTRESFQIIDDQIVLEDWNGVKYILNMDGKFVVEGGNPLS